jgi:hypothetical protein
MKELEEKAKKMEEPLAGKMFKPDAPTGTILDLRPPPAQRRRAN